ncbi:MAG: AbrB/MazE/SpoVT family DNA-binding domain-containing protein [Armatimonadota bacterium]|nr:AbrB/MazE/SpoVT family DNA-binding domain-containing protein [Armatimonadota bacterium]
MSSEQEKPSRFEDHFYGTATVGERGQIVIPAEARKKFNIETGDKLLIMGAPHKKGLMMLKADAMREFMTAILEDLQRVEQQIQDQTDPEETGS